MYVPVMFVELRIGGVERRPKPGRAVDELAIAELVVVATV